MDRKVKVRGSDVVHDGIMSVAKRSVHVAERMLAVILLIALLLVSRRSGLVLHACP